MARHWGVNILYTVDLVVALIVSTNAYKSKEHRRLFHFKYLYLSLTSYKTCSVYVRFVLKFYKRRCFLS